MPDPDPPASSQDKTYFDREAQELPLYKLRALIQHWVLPFNNVFMLCSTLGINTLMVGLADLATPRLRLFPWLTGAALMLTVLCVVLQANLWPKMTKQAVGYAAGRLLLKQYVGSFCALSLLLSVAGFAAAQSQPGARGVLAAYSPTLQALQDVLMGMRAEVAVVQAGVAAANEKLARLEAAQAAEQAEAARRQAAAAARPEALGLLSLSVLPGTTPTPAALRLHLAAYLTAPGLQLQQTRLQLQTRTDASPDWTSRDLTPQLAGALEQATLLLSVSSAVRELRLCLLADYPDPARPHALRAVYRLDTARGDPILQPAGPAQLLAADSKPCGS